MANEVKVIEFCHSLKEHAEPLIRQRAATILSMTPQGSQYIKDWISDPLKSIRIMAMRGRVSVVPNEIHANMSMRII